MNKWNLGEIAATGVATVGTTASAPPFRYFVRVPLPDFKKHGAIQNDVYFVFNEMHGYWTFFCPNGLEEVSPDDVDTVCKVATI